MGHRVPDWQGDFDCGFKPVELPFKQADVLMSKQGFGMGKDTTHSSLDPLSDFGDLGGWQEHGGMMESTKGLWSEHMEGDGIAPELRIGGLEEDLQQQEQQGNNAMAAQQAKEAHDELESWLQYPADESMDTEYCGEGFGNLPNQPVAVQAFKDSFASGLTTTRFVRPNPFCPQPMQNGSQSQARAANSAAALADGAARVSGFLPNTLPEALSRVRTQAQSTAWATAPTSAGPPTSHPVRNAPPSEKGAAVSSQGVGFSGTPTPPPRQQVVYPSIFDRNRVVAAATRVGAGTRLKAKDAKKAKPETGPKFEQPKPIGNSEQQAEAGGNTSWGVDGGPGKEVNQGVGQTQAGGPSQDGERSLPSPRSNVSDGKAAGSGSGDLTVSQPDPSFTTPQRFGGEKTLEERQRELQAELSQKQAEACAHLHRQQLMLDQHHRLEMQRWSRGQISPVQLPADRPRPGFKQLQPKPADGGLHEQGKGLPVFPPPSFLQQHAAAAESMRSGRQSVEAGPEGSAVFSSLTQERTNGSVQGAALAPGVRTPAWAALMQRGGARPGPIGVTRTGGRGGKERSSQDSRALPDNKASTLTGRDSINETTVTSSYSEGDSLATSRGYQKSPLAVGRKRDRCAKSDTEAFDEGEDTLTEGTWATGDTEGRAGSKGGAGKEKGKRSRAAEVHNQSERRRRDRINDRMRALQELIPNSNKTDKASVLDEAIEYLKNLQTQLQFMSMRTGLYASSFPPGSPHPPPMPGFHLPPVHPSATPLPHPTNGHLPPMPQMHQNLGMPPMPLHFLDHPPFALSPTPFANSPTEDSERKPPRPFGDNRGLFNAQEQRNGGVHHPLGSRLDVYEGFTGHISQ